MTGRWRVAVGVLVALGLMFVAAGLLAPSPDAVTLSARSDQPIQGPRDRVAVHVVLGDGAVHDGAAVCEGDISGSGYLADPEAAFNACTFDTSVSVHRYLQAAAASGATPRSYCPALIADAARSVQVGVEPAGTAAINAIYFDSHITRHVNALTGGACDRALWKLLTPLLAPTHDDGRVVLPYSA